MTRHGGLWGLAEPTVISLKFMKKQFAKYSLSCPLHELFKVAQLRFALRNIYSPSRVLCRQCEMSSTDQKPSSTETRYTTWKFFFHGHYRDVLIQKVCATSSCTSQNNRRRAETRVIWFLVTF